MSIPDQDRFPWTDDLRENVIQFVIHLKLLFRPNLMAIYVTELSVNRTTSMLKSVLHYLQDKSQCFGLEMLTVSSLNVNTMFEVNNFCDKIYKNNFLSKNH